MREVVKNNSQLSTFNSQLPKGWEVKELGDVCDVLDKLRKPITKKDRIAGDFPYYGATGILDYVHDFIFNEKLILIGEDGAKWFSGANSSFIVKGKYWVNNHVHVIKPNRDIILDEWIVYFLNFSDLLQYITGLTVPKLNQGKLKSIQISIPPLPEQQCIVKILDKAFVAIDKAKQNAERNLRNAKEVFENYLQGVFENKGDDWEEKTLKEISEDFGRGKSKHRPRNDKKLYGGDYPFIQTGDVRNCEHYITDYSQTYNDTGLAQSKLWPTGAICITIAANIAETGILSFDACFPDSVIGIVVNTRITNVDFVEYLLQSFKVNIQSLGKGSAQDNINMGTFEKKLFPFPSIQEQKQIVKKLNKLSAETQNIESIYQQKLNNLDELKKSILQNAFRGEL